MSEKGNYLLPFDTVIEVVAIKGDEIVVKDMMYSEWLNLRRRKGYFYRAYQKGFSQYKCLK